MMTKPSPAECIRTRLAEVEAEIVALDRQVEELRAEAAELEIAQRVLARFGGELDREHENERIEPTENPAAPSSAAPRRRGTTKPTGIPTTAEMIHTLVNEHPRGLGPLDLTKLVASRWWPGVGQNAIGPAAWREWKAGRLGKRKGKYVPASNERGSGAGTSEPLQSSDGPGAGARGRTMDPTPEGSIPSRSTNFFQRDLLVTTAIPVETANLNGPLAQKGG